MDALRVCSNSSSAFKPSRTICVKRSDGGHGGDVLRKGKKKKEKVQRSNEYLF
jgi:hypothetical protein